jgi:hypothetical protein
MARAFLAKQTGIPARVSRADGLPGHEADVEQRLFYRNQSHLARDTLPPLAAASDPGINKTLRLRDAFPVPGFY